MRGTLPRQKRSERYYASASFESRFPRCVVVGVADFRSKPEVGIFCDALDPRVISFQKKGVLMEYSRKWPPEPSQIPRKMVLGEKRDGIVKVILNPLTPQIQILIRTRFHFETITYADICPQGCRGETEPVFSPAFQVSARLTPPPPKRHGRSHGGELLDAERGSAT